MSNFATWVSSAFPLAESLSRRSSSCSAVESNRDWPFFSFRSSAYSVKTRFCF
ncbi:MAG: hypothetical protein AB8B36_11775 [Prochlorococcus sp.]